MSEPFSDNFRPYQSPEDKLNCLLETLGALVCLDQLGVTPIDAYAGIDLMNETGFIAKLLETTSVLESPTIFIKWAGYFAVSAILRDNVFFKFNSRRTRIYPNLYVMLIGDSGEVKKGPPCKIVNSLIKGVANTKLIEGRASIQGILKDLSENQISKEGTRLEGATGVIYTEELAGFMVKDPSANAILTDIYDWKDETAITLKGDEKVKLKQVVVGMWAATNEIHLQGMFSKVDIYGGLVGRMMLVIGHQPRPRNLGFDDPSTDADWNFMIDHLKKVSKFTGQASITPDAKERLNDWYQKLNLVDTSKTGFEPRMQTNVLKMGMILSACRMDRPFTGIVGLEEVEKALIELAPLRPNYYRLAGQITNTTNLVANTSQLILNYLLKNPDLPIGESTLLGSMVGLTDAWTFSRATDSLVKGGFIIVQDSRYYLTQVAKVKCGVILSKGQSIQ